MSPELLTVTVLAAPGGIVGAVCIAGHLLAGRREAAIEAAFRATSKTTPPGGDGEPLTEPEALADVLPFPARHHTTDTGQANAA